MIPLTKKGIELSVNFMVMLILAIVLFGFGMYFARELFTTSGGITERAFDEFDQQIEDLACSSADKVCVPVSTKSVGGDGYAIMGIVVENVLGERREFEIFAEPSTYVDKNGNEKPFNAANIQISPGAANKRILPIENREKKAIGIAVQPVGMPSGTYAFSVFVNYEDASGVFTSYTDGRPLKFYVVVP